MKIILEIPDCLIPREIKNMVCSGDPTEAHKRRTVAEFLRFALNQIEMCEIGVDQYRLVMK